MSKQFKYVISHMSMINDKSKEDGYFESGENFFGVYDTLEEAQEGIRKAWAWQKEHGKADWEKDGIVFTEFNFGFNEVKPGLENSEIALGLMPYEAVVNFSYVNNPHKVFDWSYSIRQIPYKPY